MAQSLSTPDLGSGNDLRVMGSFVSVISMFLGDFTANSMKPPWTKLPQVRILILYFISWFFSEKRNSLAADTSSMALIDLVIEAADFCFHYQEKTTLSMVVGRRLKEQIRREQEQEVCTEPPSLLPLQGPEGGNVPCPQVVFRKLISTTWKEPAPLPLHLSWPISSSPSLVS